MNAHDGGILTRWFAEPLSAAQRFALDQADLPMRVAESRIRQDRQRAEARAGVERLLREALGPSEAQNHA